MTRSCPLRWSPLRGLDVPTWRPPHLHSSTQLLRPPDSGQPGTANTKYTAAVLGGGGQAGTSGTQRQSRLGFLGDGCRLVNNSSRVKKKLRAVRDQEKLRN